MGGLSGAGSAGRAWASSQPNSEGPSVVNLLPSHQVLHPPLCSCALPCAAGLLVAPYVPHPLQTMGSLCQIVLCQCTLCSPAWYSHVQGSLCDPPTLGLAGAVQHVGHCSPWVLYAGWSLCLGALHHPVTQRPTHNAICATRVSHPTSYQRHLLNTTCPLSHRKNFNCAKPTVPAACGTTLVREVQRGRSVDPTRTGRRPSPFNFMLLLLSHAP